MSERSSQAPGEQGHRNRIPRDLPDQQAGGPKVPDRWYAEEPQREDEDEEFLEAEEESQELPDTDEAGSGPRGAPEPEGVHPDLPPPVESTD